MVRELLRLSEHLATTVGRQFLRIAERGGRFDSPARSKGALSLYLFRPD